MYKSSKKSYPDIKMTSLHDDFLLSLQWSNENFLALPETGKVQNEHNIGSYNILNHTQTDFSYAVCSKLPTSFKKNGILSSSAL